MAWHTLVRHLGSAEAKPEELANERRTGLIEPQQLVADRTGAAKHVHPSGRHLGKHHSSVEAPEDARSDSAEEGVVATDADADHHVAVTRLQLGEHLDDQVG